MSIYEPGDRVWVGDDEMGMSATVESMTDTHVTVTLWSGSSVTLDRATTPITKTEPRPIQECIDELKEQLRDRTDD